MALSRINSSMIGAGDVSNDEHSYLNSVTSNVQTQIDGAGGNKRVFLNLLQGDTAVPTNQWGDYNAFYMEDSTTDRLGAVWSVPDDLTAISEILFFSRSTGGSGNAYMLFEGVATASGESNATDKDTLSATTYAYSDNNLKTHDVTAMANGLTLGANHLIALQVERQALNASDTINHTVYAFGFQVTYTQDERCIQQDLRMAF